MIAIKRWTGFIIRVYTLFQRLQHFLRAGHAAAGGADDAAPGEAQRVRRIVEALDDDADRGDRLAAPRREIASGPDDLAG